MGLQLLSLKHDLHSRAILSRPTVLGISFSTDTLYIIWYGRSPTQTGCSVKILPKSINITLYTNRMCPELFWWLESWTACQHGLRPYLCSHCHNFCQPKVSQHGVESKDVNLKSTHKYLITIIWQLTMVFAGIMSRCARTGEWVCKNTTAWHTWIQKSKFSLFVSYIRTEQ